MFCYVYVADGFSLYVEVYVRPSCTSCYAMCMLQMVFHCGDERDKESGGAGSQHGSPLCYWRV